MNKGLRNLLTVILISLALAVYSLSPITTLDITASHVAQVTIPIDVEKDWDECYYVTNKADIDSIFRKINSMKLKYVGSYTTETLHNAFPEIAKSDLCTVIGLKYDVSQHDEIAFMQEYSYPYGILVFKNAYILTLNIGAEEVYYKLYRTDEVDSLAHRINLLGT